MDKLNISNYSTVGDYVKEVMLNDIKTHIIGQGNDFVLRVSRKNVYGDETFDCYRVVDGNLHRNGIDAKWSNLNKLYKAYKQIFPPK